MGVLPEHRKKVGFYASYPTSYLSAVSRIHPSNQPHDRRQALAPAASSTLLKRPTSRSSSSTSDISVHHFTYFVTLGTLASATTVINLVNLDNSAFYQQDSMTDQCLVSTVSDWPHGDGSSHIGFFGAKGIRECTCSDVKGDGEASESVLDRYKNDVGTFSRPFWSPASHASTHLESTRGSRLCSVRFRRRTDPGRSFVLEYTADRAGAFRFARIRG
jgi:hypothetical protein